MLRMLFAASAVLALLYLAACGWVYAQQRNLLYFPQATHVAAAETDFALTRADGAVLRGWAIAPAAASRPPILYFGGNAERVEHNRDDFARWFPGRSVYLVAYRGYGASDGAPTETALCADALALYDRVAADHPGQPVDVIGRSLGSGVAAYVAAHRPVSRLALVTPYDSMVDVGSAHYPWLPVRWLLRDRYDSFARLRGTHAAILVLRAGDDVVVPGSNTDRLVASLPPSRQVVAIPGAGHDDISSDPAYAAALSRFMR